MRRFALIFAVTGLLIGLVTHPVAAQARSGPALF
jgi:hypothetical protein